MAVNHSSLSTAIKGFADYLARSVPNGITVSVDTPQKAETIAKDLPNLDTVNIFVYRIAPSGFHADTTANEPTYVRVSVLITAFPRKDAEKDTDLRVLGHAMAVLQSTPEIPDIFPADPPDPNLDPETTYYRLQAALQAPTMEELNHIWTTQGGELAYRLSAAYELSLIPIEPLSYVAPPAPVSAAILDLSPNATPSLSDDPISIPPSDAALNWVPTMMFLGDDGLTNTITVPAGTETVGPLLSGLIKARVEVVFDWTRHDGTTDEQSAFRRVKSSFFDGANAQVNVPLGPTTAGDVAQIHARHPSDPSLSGNRLTIMVEDQP
ncbi:DUF4255 domain-containing protein [Shimia ponticola]|uniref:DUF4255 domain-containing protein n=1 Tax=Shimia ponticola TaxID=2582893 RepID=UPI0011BDE0C8|nr:DUF4255 domain-containing protein [Shimia ponticola]